MIEMLLESTLETFIMLSVSTLVGILFGLPLGVLLHMTDRDGLSNNRVVHLSVGFLINGIRSIPYIILVIALIPLTRLLVGTSIGTMAASVPLSIASVMLIVRIVEDSLRTVPYGLIEAALSMGATRMQIVRKILIPEALPGIVSGATLVIISLIGFSAMAGAVGGGGLGDLAIRYGYQRYNTEIIIEVVLILVAMVQLVQVVGDRLSKKLRK